MSRIKIIGGIPLHGTVKISGSKNSVLPIMAASLLTDEAITIHSVPNLDDVTFMTQLLLSLGVILKVVHNKNSQYSLCLKSSNIKYTETHIDIASKIRASFLVLGPLLGRFQKAKVAWPGGCDIGTRSVDLHLDSLRKMGASITLEGDYVLAHTKSTLIGAEINLSISSVGATENILMAAVLAKGRTIINNAAIEPEVTDLANFLLLMGAHIKGIGTRTLIIEGVEELSGVQYEIIPDRIEAFTYAAAALITDGEIILENINAKHLSSSLKVLREMGAHIENISDQSLKISRAHKKILPINIITSEYPGISTDIQPILTALLTIADGDAVIQETIFDKRFGHAAALNKLGAAVKVHGNSAHISGVKQLQGSDDIAATDLRSGAALVVAALTAKGETIMKEAYHLDRGYEDVEKKLSLCGANIKRVL